MNSRPADQRPKRRADFAEQRGHHGSGKPPARCLNMSWGLPAGLEYGRREADERDFAAAWRSQPKWVVSRSLKSVGPNATPVDGDIEAVIRGLKGSACWGDSSRRTRHSTTLTDFGLIDEYRLYFRPVVLGR